MRKRVIYMASILAMVGVIGTGCVKFKFTKTPANQPVEETMVSGDGEDFNDDAEDIQEAEVSTEAEDNYFEAEYDSYENGTEPETSVDAEGNIYHDGYVLKEKRKENLPAQAEVGYVSNVNIYSAVNSDYTETTTSSDEDDTEETKKETVPETTAKQTEAETKAVETTAAETEPETLAYPNLVGQ